MTHLHIARDNSFLMLRVIHELKMISTEVPRGNCENHEKCTQELSPLRHVKKTLDYTAKITPWFPRVLLLWEGAAKKKKKKITSITGSRGDVFVVRTSKAVENLLACVASVSNRVIARKVERKQKKRLKGEGEGRRGNACPQTPRFWKTPLDISRFGSFVNWQFVKIDV